MIDGMSHEPISLDAALASFDAVWSPRIVARFNDYDVRVAKFGEEYIWHVHEHTDEFFLCLAGEIHIALREEGGERTVVLPAGSLFVVPKGVEHKPSTPAPGATALLLEPTGTLTVGDRHDEVRADIDPTTGHPLTI
jgi:mannose-6-phosphate isomerase-like protein (cupin superfamily)